eukprot:SAG11_NODE_397_length_9785_cov_3.709581_11_plen_68_part_00
MPCLAQSCPWRAAPAGVVAVRSPKTPEKLAPLAHSFANGGAIMFAFQTTPASESCMACEVGRGWKHC